MFCRIREIRKIKSRLVPLIRIMTMSVLVANFVAVSDVHAAEVVLGGNSTIRFATTPGFVPLYCAEALALAFSGCRAEADESRAGKYLATTD
jgi:hypothetical protein